MVVLPQSLEWTERERRFYYGVTRLVLSCILWTVTYAHDAVCLIERLKEADRTDMRGVFVRVKSRQRNRTGTIHP